MNNVDVLCALAETRMKCVSNTELDLCLRMEFYFGDKQSSRNVIILKKISRV